MSKSFLTLARKGSGQLGKNNVIASFLASNFTIPSALTETGIEKIRQSIESNGSIANAQEAFDCFVQALEVGVDSEIAKKREMFDNIHMMNDLRQEVENHFKEYQTFLNGVKSSVEKLIASDIFKGLKPSEEKEEEEIVVNEKAA